MSIGVGIDEEIARLRALVEEQQERLQRLEGQSSSVAIDDRDPRSRRDLLRLAGLGLAGAAGASLLTALPAAAANGGNLILGQANDASSDTSLSLTGAADYAFKADATNGGNLTSGTSRGLEAIGLGSGTGILAVSSSGQAGVFGSTSGPDIQLGGAQPTGAKAPTGSGRLSQVLRSDTGAGKPPFSVTSGFGEVVRGASAEVWISTAGGWRRQNTTRVDKADGSGAAFPPARVLDTRSASGPTGGAPLSAGSTTTITVAGSNGIPSDAIGIVGNVTAAGYTGAGYLTIFPAGVTNPGTSSLNFGAGFAGSGWGNGFTVGLGTGANAGKVSIYVSNNGISTHVIMDITAYLQ